MFRNVGLQRPQTPTRPRNKPPNCRAGRGRRGMLAMSWGQMIFGFQRVFIPRGEASGSRFTAASPVQNFSRRAQAKLPLRFFFIFKKKVESAFY